MVGRGGPAFETLKGSGAGGHLDCQVHGNRQFVPPPDPWTCADHTIPSTCSDTDFLVEFAPGIEPRLPTSSGAGADLRALLGRGVGWVASGSVRKPCVVARISRSYETIFSKED